MKIRRVQDYSAYYPWSLPFPIPIFVSLFIGLHWEDLSKQIVFLCLESTFQNIFLHFPINLNSLVFKDFKVNRNQSGIVISPRKVSIFQNFFARFWKVYLTQLQCFTWIQENCVFASALPLEGFADTRKALTCFDIQYSPLKNGHDNLDHLT